MKCPTCSTTVPDGAAFCPQCGARLAGTAAGAAGAADPTSAATHAKTAAALGRRSGPTPAEEELWTGGYSPKAMYGAWIGAAAATIAGLVAVVFLPFDNTWKWSILGIGVVLVWGGLLINLAIQKLSVKYRLTNQRLFHEKGILRRVTDRIEVIDIDDVTFVQGIVERMLNVGTIRVTSSDRTNPELQMAGIDDVKIVADKIDQARRAERERRGLYIESI